MHLAGGFLLLITFHDRPDSLAHIFGMAAVYAWVRTLKGGTTTSARWSWVMAGCSVLSVCTGLQIGAVYGLLLCLGAAAGWLCARRKPVLAPMLALILTPPALVALVKLGFPHLWIGFLEHARQTPSLTGWRVAAIGDLLKMGRTVPGVLAAGAFLPWLYANRSRLLAGDAAVPWLVTVPSTVAALAIVIGSMTVLTPNAVSFAGYLQPLIAGGGLCLLAAGSPAASRRRSLALGCALLIALGSIRAVGLTTWGAACAADVSQRAAMDRVRAELDALPAGSSAVLSSAFLYEAARHENVRWIHSDWLVRSQKDQPAADWEGLLALKPRAILLTQFDYYRRYEPLLARLQADPALARVELLNTARTRAPDSIPSLRRVLQHVAWAPIIVHISWK
jgi:hypothetical protein